MDDQHRAGLDLIREGLALLTVADEPVPGDEQSAVLLAMQQMRGVFEVTEARWLSRWDRERVWRCDGAKVASSWLVRHQRIPRPVAAERLRHARAVHEYPAIGDAWESGEIDRSHVTTLLGVRNGRTAAAFAQAHEDLLDTARTESFLRFKAACDDFELMADPDGAEQGAEASRQAREVHLSQTLDDMWLGKITLDPISGEIVSGTLRRIEQELFEAEWAQAKQRLGRDPLTTDLPRTPAQRRADALVEMAIRARTAPKDGRRPAPLFTIVAGLDSLRSTLELWDRTRLTPGTAAHWLTDDTLIERVVFASPSRVIDLSATERLFGGALRRAVLVRDRTCYVEGCDTPPERLQVDHIHEASKGGPTTQENGRPACRFHNLRRNNHPDDDPDPQPAG